MDKIGANWNMSMITRVKHKVHLGTDLLIAKNHCAMDFRLWTTCAILARIFICKSNDGSEASTSASHTEEKALALPTSQKNSYRSHQTRAEGMVHLLSPLSGSYQYLGERRTNSGAMGRGGCSGSWRAQPRSSMA